MPTPFQCAGGIGSEPWRKLIFDSAEAFGIKVSQNQMSQLIRFARILCDWNKKINLTAITDPQEVAIKHFIDSMAVLPFLPEGEHLLDIGSGGGFPGLVLAIFRPDLKITSIDGVRKKISFQQHIIRTLGLRGATALNSRAEALAPANHPARTDSFDIIVSRALGALDFFIGLSLPLLAPGGAIIAYKGSTGDEIREEAESCMTGELSFSIDIQTYHLPKYGDRRALVFVKPT